MHKLIKPTFVALALATLTILTASAQSREERKTVDFTAGGELRVHSDRGTVRLTGWERNQVEVVARIVKPEWSDPDFDPRAIELTRIEVSGDSRALTIRANFDDVPYKGGQKWLGRSLPQVHFDIRAPRNLNLTLEADRGEVELRDVAGRLNVTTDRSTLKAESLSGDIRLRMDRGEAQLAGVSGKLSFYSDRTNVTLRAPKFSEDSSLEVSRGEIELRVPASVGFYVSANTGRRAEFESDFPIATRNFNGDRVEGTINGGGPQVAFRTDRGKVKLRRD